MADAPHDAPSTAGQDWRSRVLWRMRDAATLASVIWLALVVVAAGMAFWSARPGSASCRATNEAVAADGDAGDADYGDGGTAPASTAVLEPAVERPVVLPLGRTRGVRTARSSLTVTPLSADDPAAAAAEGAAEQAGTTTGGNASVAGSEPATGTSPDGDPIAQQDASVAPADGTQAGTPPVLPDVERPLPLQVRVNQFVREDGTSLRTERRASDEAGGADEGSGGADETVPLVTANAFSRRGVVTVELCVDRDGESIGAPGRYEGSVTIVDPRVTPADAAFVVVLAYPNAGLVALLTLVAIAAAAVYSWRVHDVVGDADEPMRFHSFFGWLRKWRGFFAVSTGTVAAYVAFSATYLSNSVWGTSVTQFTAIVGAVFTAFVTAATTIIAGSRMGRSSNKGG